MPCTSFSIARKWDGLGPGPLRDADNIYGFPWLAGADLQKVRTGNQLLRFSVRIMELCQQLHIPYALENPKSSFAWQTPLLSGYKDKYSPSVVHLDYCQFGEPWQKPTTLLGNFWDMAPLGLRCHSSNNRCTRTGLSHVRLTGVDHNRLFMTLKAQPYPLQFAAAVATLVAKATS
eukprot:Skav235917  [mRNA]  locus=scaffold3781:92807:93331:- [translate_table: standard]